MRISYILFLGFVLTGFFFSINDAYGAVFIKFDGLDGESADKDHKNWSDLVSFSEGAKIRGDTLATRNTYEFSDVIIIKELDKSSPKLAESIAMGKVFPKVEIHLTSTEGTFYAYDLTNVMITNYSISGSDNQIPIEEFSLNYEKIKRMEMSAEKTKDVVTEKPLEASTKDVLKEELMMPSTSKVPLWVQTTAQFWIDKNVSDREFTDALGFLVKEKIIEVNVETPLTETDQISDEESQVPDWIATTTKWWINGEVPEDQFLEGIKWMIKNKIIKGIS